MRRYEIRTSTVAETTDEQIKALAASFYPTIKAFIIPTRAERCSRTT